MDEEDLQDVVRIVLFLSNIDGSATIPEITLATGRPEDCIASVLCQLEVVNVVFSTAYRKKSYALKRRLMPDDLEAVTQGMALGKGKETSK